MAFRPASLGKRVSSSWPTVWGVVLPATVALTWPWALMVTRDGVLRNGDARLDHQTVLGHELALGAEREIARAGIGVGAVGLLDAEEARALDGDVVGIAGGLEVALGGDAIDGGGAHAGAQLDAVGRIGALVGGLRAGGLDVLIEQVGEFGPLLLEGGGVHVRQIVGDHFDIGLLGQHAGRGDGKGAHYRVSLIRASGQGGRSPGASCLPGTCSDWRSPHRRASPRSCG